MGGKMKYPGSGNIMSITISEHSASLAF